MSRGGTTVFSVVFGWIRAKKLCFNRMLFSVFCLGSFWFKLIGIFGFLTFSAQSLGYVRHEENPGKLLPCCSLYFKTPSSSAFFLHFPESSYVCFICKIQIFKLYSGGQ